MPHGLQIVQLVASFGLNCLYIPFPVVAYPLSLIVFNNYLKQVK